MSFSPTSLIVAITEELFGKLSDYLPTHGEEVLDEDGVYQTVLIGWPDAKGGVIPGTFSNPPAPRNTFAPIPLIDGRYAGIGNWTQAMHDEFVAGTIPGATILTEEEYQDLLFDPEAQAFDREFYEATLRKLLARRMRASRDWRKEAVIADANGKCP